MRKLNPRYVHFVHLKDDTKGTHRIIVEGVNDQNRSYEISLWGIGGPSAPEEERRIVAHIEASSALKDPTITYKYGVLLTICNFVSSFFEPHHKEDICTTLS